MVCFVDKLIVGLLIDFKVCGLFDEMLVIWGGEFGWILIVENGNGCDYNFYGFMMWMVGGGVCLGFVYGCIDEYGYYVVEKKVYFYDLYVMVLYLMGINYQELIFCYSGWDFWLIDVYGEVVDDLVV